MILWKFHAAPCPSKLGFGAILKVMRAASFADIWFGMIFDKCKNLILEIFFANKIYEESKERLMQ